MNNLITIIAALAVAGAFATPARADGNNDRDIDFEDLEIRDNGESLTIEGDLDDLDDDDGDVTVILRARGDAQYRCERRGHDRRDDEEVKLSGKDTIDRDEFDNDDDAKFRVKTDSVRERDVRDNRCRDVDIRDVEFTRFRIFVVQDDELRAVRTCWFDDPTDDGKVRSKDVDCSRSRNWDDDWDWGEWDDDDWGKEASGSGGGLLWR